MSEISEKAIKLIKDLRRDISIDIMFTPEKNAENNSLKALTDYIAELEAAQRWIPVSARLPELDQDVLAIVEGDIVTGHFYQQWDGEIYFSSDDEGAMMVATHWMPLPESPIVYGKVCEE